MSQQKPIRIFLSHSAEDRELARELSQRLRSWSGISVQSPDDISVGQQWARLIRDRIRRSDLVMFLITPNSVRSPWVLQEMGAAWALDKNIVLVSSDAELASRLPFTVQESQILGLQDLSDPELVTSFVKRVTADTQEAVAKG